MPVLGRYRHRFRAIERALAAPFVALRIHPTALTLTALVPAVAAAYLLAEHRWFAAILVGLLAGGIDLLDGAVARASGRVTSVGGFLDSVIDRVVDAIVLFGLGFALGTTEGWLLIGAGLVGAYGTSYARARAHEDIHIPKPEWSQLFERGERLALLLVGVTLHAVAEATAASWSAPGGRSILFWTMVAFAVGANVTFVQRVLFVRRRLRDAAP